MELLNGIESIIKVDTEMYAPVLSQFPQEFNIGHLSAYTLWTMFSTEIKFALDGHEQDRRFTSLEYINLHFLVKRLYNNYCRDIPQLKNQVPEYPTWFEPFVMQWLNDNDETSLRQVDLAFKRDKNDGFPLVSAENSPFSNSVVDIFTLIQESFNIIKQLECPDPEVVKRYMKRFAKSLVKVLGKYSEILKAEFPSFISNDKIACVLMNNVAQMRIMLDKMVEAMSDAMSEEMEEDAANILRGLQQSISRLLDELSAAFSNSMRPMVRDSIMQMGAMLSQLRGNAATTSTNGQATGDGFAGANQNGELPPEVIAETDHVLRPLLDVLDGKLTMLAKHCMTNVLKRILKELWKLVIQLLEKLIVLPPTSDRNLLHNLPSAKIEDVSRLLKSHMGSNKVTGALGGGVEALQFERNLTMKQCQVLNVAQRTLKQYFHAGGEGLKLSSLDKSPELQSLKNALSLYTQSTDTLIKTFITTQNEQGRNHSDEKVGLMNVDVDLSTHPGSGENKVTIKIVECKELSWPDKKSFKPFIEVNIIGPNLGDLKSKRKFETKCSAPNVQRQPGRAPEVNYNYNETFVVSLGNELDPSFFEIHMVVKHYRTLLQNLPVGVAVIQLRDVMEQGSCAGWFHLGKSIYMDETGWTILRILSQRTNDEAAKEFVELKTFSLKKTLADQDK